MGIWAGIKHALNSTLGTKDFKPLDELFKDSFQSLKTTVQNAINSVTVVASDTPLKILLSSKTQLSSSGIKKTFTANLNGTVKIKAEIENGISNYSVVLSCVNSSGQSVGSKTVVSTTSSFYIDINVTKGVTYTVTISGNQVLSCSQLIVCGSTISGKPIA